MAHSPVVERTPAKPGNRVPNPRGSPGPGVLPGRNSHPGRKVFPNFLPAQAYQFPDSMMGSLEQLTDEQASYIGVSKVGPYKADTYRY